MLKSEKIYDDSPCIYVFSQVISVHLYTVTLSLLLIADVWNHPETKKSGRGALYLSRSTGEFIKYVTRFNDEEIVLEFADFSAYDEPDQVSNARLTDEEKESCYLMFDASNFAQCTPPSSLKRCEGCQEDVNDLIEDLTDAYLEEVASVETGLIEESIDLDRFSTKKDYEMRGSEEEQAVVNGLKSFQPGMVGRKMLRVRNQSNCGSCYSFSLSHTITSSYAQENPDSDLLVFSNQHLMNCIPLIPGEGNVPQDSMTGCWGGGRESVIDMVVYYGGKVPLLNAEPYLGFQSHCDLEQEMVDTGKVIAFIIFIHCSHTMHLLTRLPLLSTQTPRYYRILCRY